MAIDLGEYIGANKRVSLEVADCEKRTFGIVVVSAMPLGTREQVQSRYG